MRNENILSRKVIQKAGYLLTPKERIKISTMVKKNRNICLRNYTEINCTDCAGYFFESACQKT